MPLKGYYWDGKRWYKVKKSHHQNDSTHVRRRGETTCLACGRPIKVGMRYYLTSHNDPYCLTCGIPGESGEVPE